MSEFLKFDKNGQWNLYKAVAGLVPHVMTVSKLIKPTDLVNSKKANAGITQHGVKVAPAKLPNNVKSYTGAQHRMSAAKKADQAESVHKCEQLLYQMIETLEKSVYNAGMHPAKGYVPGKKQAKDVHAEYDPKYSFKDNRELVRMHHQDHTIPVKGEAHLDSLTRAAAKRGGHTIKE